MALKIFADTNIIVDLIEQRPFDLELIHQLVILAESGEIEIYISETVITNALYITKLNDHVKKVLEFSKTVCINGETIRKALNSGFKDKEDAILYYGAVHAKMDFFITRNEKDFVKGVLSQLPVLSVKAFLKKLKS